VISTIAIVLVLLAAAILLGLAFGKSVERSKANDARARAHAEHEEELKGFQARLEAVNAASQFFIGARDLEISELKAALEAEKRAHFASVTKQAPAEWGEAEPAPAPAPIETT
jgi:hypothetical protein